MFFGVLWRLRLLEVGVALIGRKFSFSEFKSTMWASLLFSSMLSTSLRFCGDLGQLVCPFFDLYNLDLKK